MPTETDNAGSKHGSFCPECMRTAGPDEKVDHHETCPSRGEAA